MRTLGCKNSFSVLQYHKSFENKLPNKCILLLNHTHIDNSDYIPIFLLLSLFPEYKYITITSDKYKKCNKKMQKYLYILGKELGGQYIIYDTNDFYRDMTKHISSHEKIIIIIYPEGMCKRTNSLKNYDINQENINNFNIIENNCFNYHKGAFVLALMNSIHVIQSISYSPMPNYNYNYFNKNYSINHINHLGVKIFKSIYYERSGSYKHLPINELS